LENRKKENHYYILMILTDGIINDMQETIDCIVEGSKLPLSIVIIGIGDADFTNMHDLDGDEVPLINSSGEIRKRDIVQFVEFKKFKEKDITEKKNILINIERNLVTLLKETNQFKELKGYRYSIYKLYFEQQRLIYTNLGKCILRENFIDGRVWIPKNKLIDVQTTLNNLFKDQENRLNASLTDIENEPNFNPPTLILVNEFTLIPQLIVDTFGIPRYKEINTE